MNNPTVIDDEFVRWSTGRIPLHRMGQPDEMVGAAIYLASDAASFTNGTVIMLRRWLHRLLRGHAIFKAKSLEEIRQFMEGMGIPGPRDF